MRTALRILGWLIASVAAALLTLDVWVFAESGAFRPLPLGRVWFELDPTSLQLAEAAISRHVHQILWHPIISTVLTWPGFAVLGGLAALCCLASRRPRRAGDRNRTSRYFKQE